MAAQDAWGRANGLPPLLTVFGVSLMERAVIDAFCRAKGASFFSLLSDNRFGIDLAKMRPELTGVQLADCLPGKPLNVMTVRHTVGMSDPLTEQEISPRDAVDDGLPQSLEANIRRYGLRYFKIKLSGQLDADRARLRAIAQLLNRCVSLGAKFSLDGNENYRCMEEFRDHWNGWNQDAVLRKFLTDGLLFVEQPVHRDLALAESVQSELLSWPDAPPLIIDESDCELASLPRALRLGYAGTSHKNCKGVIKGCAQAASVMQVRSRGVPCILSAEDLGNVGPVALLQDLAVVAALGIPHAERNGHHYFPGLSMFPEAEQRRVLTEHPDLYEPSLQGFPTLRITDGLVSLDSVNRSPFGVSGLVDVNQMDEWMF